MTHNKGNQNHLVLVVFTSLLIASLLIVNSNKVSQGLQAKASSNNATTQ